MVELRLRDAEAEHDLARRVAGLPAVLAVDLQAVVDLPLLVAVVQQALEARDAPALHVRRHQPKVGSWVVL